MKHNRLPLARPRVPRPPAQLPRAQMQPETPLVFGLHSTFQVGEQVMTDIPHVALTASAFLKLLEELQEATRCTWESVQLLEGEGGVEPIDPPRGLTRRLRSRLVRDLCEEPRHLLLRGKQEDSQQAWLRLFSNYPRE